MRIRYGGVLQKLGTFTPCQTIVILPVCLKIFLKRCIYFYPSNFTFRIFSWANRQARYNLLFLSVVEYSIKGTPYNLYISLERNTPFGSSFLLPQMLIAVNSLRCVCLNVCGVGLLGHWIYTYLISPRTVWFLLAWEKQFTFPTNTWWKFPLSTHDISMFVFICFSNIFATLMVVK